MKPPILLKTILDICFFFLILSFFSSLIATFYLIFTGDGKIPITLNDFPITEFTPNVILLLCMQIIVAGLVLYTVFLLRRLIRNFLKGKFFTQYQIKTLKQIGQLIFIITVTKGFLGFVDNVLLREQARIEIGIDISFESFWFLLALGLFFIYLSKIFNNARISQEENELTI